MAVESILKVGDESGLALFLSVLKDKDARVRNSAVKILTGLGDLAIDALTKSLEDEDDDIVRYSADCIGDIGNKRGLKPLLGALERSQGDSRYYIILALGKLRESGAVPALISCLDEDMWIQTAALEALGDIGDNRAVDKIIEVMQGELFLAAPSSDALGKIGEARAVPAILANIESDNAEIISAAVKALVRIKEANKDFEHADLLAYDFNKDVIIKSLISTLGSDDPEARGGAAVVLGWLKAEESAESLAKLLDDEDYDVSRKAGETLAVLGGASVDSLLGFMDIPEKRARLLAIQALEEIKDERSIAYALRTLDDEDEDIRIAAINLLGKVGNDTAVDKLLPFLDEYSELLRTTAVKALVNIEIGKKRRQDLLGRIEEGSDLLKRSIAEIMGLLRVTEAKSALEGLLLDGNNNVKQASVFALAEIEGKEGMGSVPEMLLGSEDPVLRKSAAIVIGKLADKRGVQPLILTAQDSDPWVRYHSISSLTSLGDERAIDIIKKAISDPIGIVRIAALKGLLKLSPSEIDEKLILMKNEDDEDVRRTFLEALVSKGGELSGDVFIDSLQDDSWKVRELAVKALGDLEDDESLEALKKMIDDDDYFVKNAVKTAMKKRAACAL
jgi:HEAT repeat protein